MEVENEPSQYYLHLKSQRRLTLLQLRTFGSSMHVAPFRFHLGLNKVHLQTSKYKC